MSRWLSLVLAFFVVPVATAAMAQSQFPSDSRLKSITETKTIRIAYRTDATPFSFANDNHQAIGFSIDLCQLVTKSIAQQFGLQDLAIQWVPVDVHTRLTAVSGGQADLECGSTTVTLGRMKEVDFSNVIFVESTGMLVTRASNISGFAGMAGKKIAVVSGTTNGAAVMAQSRRDNIDVTLVNVNTRDEGTAALQSGKVDGYAADKLLLVGTQIKDPQTVIMLPDDLSIEAYAIVLPRGDWALRLAVNSGLAQIYRSGMIVTVFKKWFAQLGLEPGVLARAAYALGGLSE
jgi:glutamate/aspartate transport system substrate-binding protein